MLLLSCKKEIGNAPSDDTWKSDRRLNPKFKADKLAKYMPDLNKDEAFKKVSSKPNPDNIVNALRWEFAFLPDRLVANLRMQPEDRLVCFIHLIDRSCEDKDFFNKYSSEKYKGYPIKRSSNSIFMLVGSIEIQSKGLLPPYTDEINILNLIEHIRLSELAKFNP